VLSDIDQVDFDRFANLDRFPDRDGAGTDAEGTESPASPAP
jgi:hypothetical protein